MPWPHYPGEEFLGVILIGGCDPGARMEVSEQEKCLLPVPGIETRSLGCPNGLQTLGHKALLFVKTV